MARLKTLTIKVPALLSTKVLRLAKRLGVSQSEVIREALQSYAGAERPSFSDAAAGCCGVATGPGDLSTNARYLEDFGE
jgi:predicted transcriptional regulator